MKHVRQRKTNVITYMWNLNKTNEYNKTETDKYGELVVTSGLREGGGAK